MNNLKLFIILICFLSGVSAFAKTYSMSPYGVSFEKKTHWRGDKKVSHFSIHMKLPSGDKFELAARYSADIYGVREAEFKLDQDILSFKQTMGEARAKGKRVLIREIDISRRTYFVLSDEDDMKTIKSSELSQIESLLEKIRLLQAGSGSGIEVNRKLLSELKKQVEKISQ